MISEEYFNKAIAAYEEAHKNDSSEEKSEPETLVIMSYKIARSMVEEYDLFEYLEGVERTEEGNRKWTFVANEATRVVSNKLIKDRRREKQNNSD